MKEILFRAKSKNNGTWVEGYYAMMGVNSLIRHYIVQNCAVTNLFENPEDNMCFNDVEIDPETLCQFIGLKDKNGKRIWENDIVSAWSEGKYATGRVKQRFDGLYIIYPVYQHDEFWGLCPDKNRETNVEVIGNVFDNPELIGGSK